MPEVIEDGISGVIVSSIDEAVSAVAKVRRMKRATVRNEFEMRFTTKRMAADYIETFENNLQGAKSAVALPKVFSPHLQANSCNGAVAFEEQPA